MSSKPKQFIPCNDCKAFKDTPPGYKWSKNHNLVRCICREQYDNYLTNFYKLIKHGFDTGYLDYDIDTEYLGKQSIDECTNIKEFIRGMLSGDDVDTKYKEAVLYIWGERGTQKTSVAQYIGKSILIHSNLSAVYTTIYKLIDIVAQLQDRDDDRVRQLLNTDLLIIDEFGNNYVTRSKYELPFVDNFIRERIHNRKATIFIANDHITTKSMADKIGDNLQDFINRMTILRGAFLHMKDVYIQQAEAYDKNVGLFGPNKSSKPISKRIAKI